MLVSQNIQAEQKALDQSQQVYDRKAAFFIPLVGLPTNRLNVSANLCTQAGFVVSSPCLKYTSWNYSISSIIPEFAALQSIWLLGERFDKITIDDSNVGIQLKSEKIEVNAPRIKKFTSTFANKNFQSELDAYLNTEVIDFIEPLLVASNQARYKELSTREQMTFIAKEAKLAGIPEQAYLTLMNSSYAIATKVEYIKTDINFKTEVVALAVLEELIVSTEFVTEMQITMFVYRFNADTSKYTLFKKFDTTSNIKDTGEIYSDAPPKNLQMLHKSILNNVLNSYRAGLLVLSNKLKVLSEFKLTHLVQGFNDEGFSVKLQDVDGLRVGSMFEILRSIDNNIEKIGYGRGVVIAGNNNSLVNSQFELIKGEVDTFDLVAELPWSGNYRFLGFGMRQLNVEKFIGLNPKQKQYQLPTFRFGREYSRGFTANRSSKINSWAGSDIGIAINSTGLTDAKTDFLMYESLSFLNYGYDFIRKHYLGSGLSVSYGLGVSLDIIYFDPSETWIEEFYFFNLGLRPSLAIGYFFSEKNSISVSLDYSLSINKDYSVSEYNSEANFDTYRGYENLDAIDYSSFDMNYGLGIWFSWQWATEEVADIFKHYRK